MCGIVGYLTLGNNEVKHDVRDHFMRYALALDTLRGPDSTGLIQVRNEFAVQINKSLMPGLRFVSSKQYNNAVSKPAWAAIGHNRAATKGSVKLENAHPFRYGDVAMVHNGTLNDMGKSLPTFQKEFEVDSMQIAYALSQFDPGDAPEVLELVDGSFCLVWVDTRDQSLNIARNYQRPMHFAYNMNRSVMWFMSDGNHLNTINKSFGTHAAAGSAIYSLDGHKILKFKKGTIKPEVISFRPFVRPVVKGPSTQKSDSDKMKENLRRAASDWETRSRRSSTISSPTNVRAKIGDKTRPIPLSMCRHVEEFFNLEVGRTVQFTPKEYWELDNKRCMVEGTIVHPEWGDIPWDAVMMDVPLVNCTAYSDRDWLARVEGVGKPLPGGEMEECPSLRVQFVHTDWKGEKKAREYEANTEVEEKKEDEEEKGTVREIVMGPQNRMIKGDYARTLIDQGCCQCGGNLEMEKLKEYAIVNEGRDLICGVCAKESLDACLLH